MNADHRAHPSAADPVRRLVETLLVDEALVTETVETIYATVPGYEGVPVASLEASTRRNRELSIRTILDGRAPDADRIEEAESLTAERMAQAVPIGSVLAGFRVCMSVILRHLLDASPRYGIPAETALSFSLQLWSLADAFSARAVSANRERMIAQAVADSTRRAQWISAAVLGGLEAAEVRTGAETYGVPSDRPVRALRVGPAPEDPTAAADRVQDWAERAGTRALIAPRAGGAVGLLIGAPDPQAMLEGDTVALGPPTELGDLPSSSDVAARVLAAARRVGVTGAVDVERLSWRMGIHLSPETTEMLHARYLAPVRSAGGLGAHLTEAVEAYLSHRLSVARAAESLPVHVNTLRYRLRRFEELTGADLKDHETLIEISWALAAEQGDSPSAFPSPSPSASQRDRALSGGRARRRGPDFVEIDELHPEKFVGGDVARTRGPGHSGEQP